MHRCDLFGVVLLELVDALPSFFLVGCTVEHELDAVFGQGLSGDRSGLGAGPRGSDPTTRGNAPGFGTITT